MKVLKCDKCPFITIHRGSIINHRLTAHSSLKPLICTICSFRTKTKQCLILHSKRHETALHLRKPYLCTFENCDYRATRNSSLKLHIKAKHTPSRTKDIQCPLCSEKFYQNVYLQAHIPTHLMETKFACKLCTFVTTKKSYLKCHIQGVHERERRFKCTIPGCNYKTDYDGSKRRHMRQHNSDPLVRLPFPCSYPNCAYRAPSRHRLNRHTRALHQPQNESKKFTCTLCSKNLANRDTLTAHIKRIHAREEVYSCDKCEFQSYYSDSITTHRLRVHKEGKPLEKRFKCEFCDYCSSDKRNRDCHTMTMHTDRRRLKCESFGCNYATNYGGTMRKHVLVHEKDPEKRLPFACTFPGCDFRGGSKSKIKRHEQLHLASRQNHACDLCGDKCYPDSGSLRFHKWIAHAKGTLDCSKCGFATCSSAALRRHTSTYHNNSNGSRVMAGRRNFYISDNISSNSGGDDEETCRRNPDHTAPEEIGNFEGPCGKSPIQCSTYHKIPVVLLRKVHVEVL